MNNQKWNKQDILVASQLGEISMIDAEHLVSVLEEDFSAEREYILCSAIWYKELPTQIHLPVNVEKGIVVLGHRHSHCIDVVRLLSGLRTVRISPDGVGETEQGFLTNKNRFVNREEAFVIAENARQINDRVRGDSKTLFSEDLY